MTRGIGHPENITNEESEGENGKAKLEKYAGFRAGKWVHWVQFTSIHQNNSKTDYNSKLYLQNALNKYHL